jgi:hypothetical protein
MSIVRARPRPGEIGLADDWSSPIRYILHLARAGGFSPVGRPLVRYFGSPIVHLLVKRAEYHAAIVLD